MNKNYFGISHATLSKLKENILFFCLHYNCPLCITPSLKHFFNSEGVMEVKRENQHTQIIIKVINCYHYGIGSGWHTHHKHCHQNKTDSYNDCKRNHIEFIAQKGRKLLRGEIHSTVSVEKNQTKSQPLVIRINCFTFQITKSGLRLSVLYHFIA